MENRIMELEVSPGRISFSKQLNELDNLALDFAENLESAGIRYTVVSGYVAIMLGRMRASEYIDILVEEVDQERFARLWSALSPRYECVQTASPAVAFTDYLAQDSAVRFLVKGSTGPDVEVKFARKDHHLRSMASPIEVFINGRSLRIGPLELQIAHKLVLASDKDLEDARYIYRLMKEHLDLGVLRRELRLLDVPLEVATRELGAVGWSE
ncbi:MAG TPA: hypothetical protein VI893_07615 [Thermoplasmata archaeon]|nr:hypothetical protein [Thermoplasmata archaeon]